MDYIELTEQLIVRLKEKARQYTLDNIEVPTRRDFIYTENAFLAGALEAISKRGPVGPCDVHEADVPEGFLEVAAKDKWHSVGAYCKKCRADLGWLCAKSPNMVCDYDELEDPIHDNCIYCGMPSERK